MLNPHNPQNCPIPSCSAATPENPKAAAASIFPNWLASAETVFPRQLACPGIPALGTVFPDNEKVMLKVGAGESSIISVPIRSQSGFQFVLRIQACKSRETNIPREDIIAHVERTVTNLVREARCRYRIFHVVIRTGRANIELIARQESGGSPCLPAGWRKQFAPHRPNVTISPEELQ